MSSLRYLFFDVGHTLLTPDYRITHAPLHRRGFCPTGEQLRATEIRARHEMDARRLEGHAQGIDVNYWNIYLDDLLPQLGAAGPRTDASLKNELMALGRSAMNYTQVLPMTDEALRALKGRYRLAVISNADGMIRRLLEHVKLAHHFESITDSTLVGYEKPAPEIFRIALDSMGAAAAESLYIGDVYSVDYAGATAVGMKAVLYDRMGIYDAMDVPRVSRLDQLEELIQQL